MLDDVIPRPARQNTSPDGRAENRLIDPRGTRQRPIIPLVKADVVFHVSVDFPTVAIGRVKPRNLVKAAVGSHPDFVVVGNI